MNLRQKLLLLLSLTVAAHRGRGGMDGAGPHSPGLRAA